MYIVHSTLYISVHCTFTSLQVAPVISSGLNIFSFNYNFGTSGIMDRLHQTHGPFRGSVNEKRDYTSFKLASVKQRHPHNVKSTRKSN